MAELPVNFYSKNNNDPINFFSHSGIDKLVNENLTFFYSPPTTAANESTKTITSQPDKEIVVPDKTKSMTTTGKITTEVTSSVS